MLPTISVLADNTLLKIACHFLLLLVGFDTLTYRKDYDRSPTLVGHQDSYSCVFPIHALLFITMYLMTHKCRGSIVVFSISKSVEPNEEQKEMISSFQ